MLDSEKFDTLHLALTCFHGGDTTPSDFIRAVLGPIIENWMAEQARELEALHRELDEMEGEPEWLDTEALEGLPRGTLVESRDGDARSYSNRRVRHFGRASSGWIKIGYSAPSCATSEIAPARVLWDPDADR